MELMPRVVAVAPGGNTASTWSSATDPAVTWIFALEVSTWTGVLTPLRDPAFFAQVALDEEAGMAVWPNGLDFAPEALYDDVVVCQETRSAATAP